MKNVFNFTYAVPIRTEISEVYILIFVIDFLMHNLKKNVQITIFIATYRPLVFV